MAEHKNNWKNLRVIILASYLYAYFLFIISFGRVFKISIVAFFILFFLIFFTRNYLNLKRAGVKPAAIYGLLLKLVSQPWKILAPAMILVSYVTAWVLPFSLSDSLFAGQTSAFVVPVLL